MFRNFTNSVATIVSAFLLIGLPEVSFATPPVKAECTGSGIEDVFDRLACKQSAIAEQMAYTSDEVFKGGTKLNQSLNSTHIRQIKNAKEKAIRSKKKNNKAFFKRQAKSEARGNKQAGHLVPFDDFLDDDNQDGICDYEQEGVGAGTNAQCAAIELSSSGQLQICNPEKKNKGKGKANNPKFEGFECDRSNDLEEAAGSDEEEDIVESAEQLAASYEVVEDNLIAMNEALDTVNETSPAPMFTTASGCVIPTSDPALFAATVLLRQIQSSTFGGARIMADIMGQDGLGFNARAGAAAFDSIALVARLALNATEDIQRAESAELQVAIMECTAQTANAIAELRAEVAILKTLMQQEHGAIMDNDDENAARIIQLLNTPQGRREQFPIR